MRVGILDDHAVVREGVKAFLELQNIEVSFDCSNPKDLIACLNQGLPDVLIADVVMDGVLGLEVFEMLNNDFPALKTIAFTSLDNLTLVAGLIHCGVRGHVSKNDSMASLLKACIQVYDGGLFIPEKYHSLLRITNRENTDLFQISEREADVLALISKGHTTVEISELLFISVNTVETHRKNLFRKFDVNNIAQLIMKAKDTGLIH